MTAISCEELVCAGAGSRSRSRGRRIGLRWALLLLLCAVPAAADNLLSNPAFESGINGWSVDAADTTVGWESDAHAFHALYTGPTRDVDDGDIVEFLVRADVPIVGGATYRFGGWVKVAGASIPNRGARMAVCFVDATGAIVEEGGWCPATSPLSDTNGRFVDLNPRVAQAPAGATTAEVYLVMSFIQGLQSSFDDVYFDGPAGRTLQTALQGELLSVGAGGPLTLVWSTSNATAVSIDGLGSVPPTGSRVVVPTPPSTTYTLRATNGEESSDKSFTVEVPVASPPAIDRFEAFPSAQNLLAISTANAQNVTLSWSTTGATAVRIDPDVGSVQANGTVTVHPDQTTLYTLKAGGPGGQTTRTREVVVSGQSSPTVDTPTGRTGEAGSEDGVGDAARFRNPAAIQADGNGNLFVVDAGNHTIRRIDPSGRTETWAGQPGLPGTRDGYRGQAQFDFSGFSGGFFVDRDGSIKVQDTSGWVRRINPAGNVSTCSLSCGSLLLSGVVRDAAGNEYDADAGSHTIRRKRVGSPIEVLAGSTGQAGFHDALGSAARFNRPLGIAVDASGNVYVSDTGNNAIRRIAPDGRVTTIAGALPPLAQGTRTHSDLNDLFSFGATGGALVMGGDGLLYVVDSGSNTVKSIDPQSGSVRTVAGSGAAAKDDGSAASAGFRAPRGIALDPSGNLLIADTGNHAIRRINLTGAGGEGLPLLGNRFLVDVRYRNQFANPPAEGRLTGRSLFASATSETAVFVFDDPDVVELLVRLSDARPFDNHVHLFYGGLSDVEFFIKVTDSLTGTVKEYRKAPNEIVGGIDRGTFIADPASPVRGDLAHAMMAAIGSRWFTLASAPDALRMFGGRYEVRVRYRNQFASPPTEGTLLGSTIASSPLTETAVFYFENRESVEWMVRFSDARPFDNHIHLFHGGLTDVGLTIEVTDTLTGLKREYTKLPNSLAGFVDRGSFVP